MLRELYPQTRRILIDSNLFIILIAGKVRPALLGSIAVGNIHLTMNDVELLGAFISEYGAVVTTPYLLTEVSSLINSKVDANSQPECWTLLSEYIHSFENNHLQPIPLAQDNRFQRFGIGDISILHTVDEKTLVLTDDRRLAGQLNNKNVVNYIDLKDSISAIR